MKRYFQAKVGAPRKKAAWRKKSQSGSAGPTQEQSHDEAMRFLNAEYWEGVKRLAEEVKNLIQKEGMDQSDALHQVVDGSYWVIYTHANFQVLMCSQNHDAYSEEYGQPPVEGDSINWAAAAYAAMAQDVSGEVGDIEPDLEEAPRRRRTRVTRETLRGTRRR